MYTALRVQGSVLFDKSPETHNLIRKPSPRAHNTLRLKLRGAAHVVHNTSE